MLQSVLLAFMISGVFAGEPFCYKQSHAHYCLENNNSSNYFEYIFYEKTMEFGNFQDNLVLLEYFPNSKLSDDLANHINYGLVREHDNQDKDIFEDELEVNGISSNLIGNEHNSNEKKDFAIDYKVPESENEQDIDSPNFSDQDKVISGDAENPKNNDRRNHNAEETVVEKGKDSDFVIVVFILILVALIAR